MFKILDSRVPRENVNSTPAYWTLTELSDLDCLDDISSSRLGVTALLHIYSMDYATVQGQTPER